MITAISLKRSSWLLWSTSPAQRRAAILYTIFSLRHSFKITSSTSEMVGWPVQGFCSSALIIKRPEINVIFLKTLAVQRNQRPEGWLTCIWRPQSQWPSAAPPGKKLLWTSTYRFDTANVLTIITLPAHVRPDSPCIKAFSTMPRCGATNDPVCSLATVAMAAAPWAFIFQDWDCNAFCVIVISSVM